jgi:hypothetical protein
VGSCHWRSWPASGRSSCWAAGLAVIVAVIIAVIVELARGHDPAPYDWLGAIAGVSYLAAVVILRIRG